MAGIVFNIAKGRVGEFFNRVDTNDPANSALIVCVMKDPYVGDSAIIDADTLSAVLTGSQEVTNTNYARKTLTDTDIGPFTPDDTNDRFDYDLPDFVYTAVAAGTNWRKVVISYDSDTTSGTDANIIPLLAQDITVNPDGSNITLQIASTGIFRAQ